MPLQVLTERKSTSHNQQQKLSPPSDPVSKPQLDSIRRSLNKRCGRNVTRKIRLADLEGHLCCQVALAVCEADREPSTAPWNSTSLDRSTFICQAAWMPQSHQGNAEW